jgi:trans-2,3-dihydro-3-hydroxyanthranilate isomerase
MLKTLKYTVLDVFAERPLEGNPLAVFHDATGMTDEMMQALARETNLAETTFIFPEDPAAERSEGVRVRIFTTTEELPFAGHPTLGTATWLYLNHPELKGAETIKLRLNVGPIYVRFEVPSDGEAGVRATMTQNDPVFGATHDRAEVARAIGFAVEDLSPTFAPQTVSTGVPFCIVLLRSQEVLQRLQISPRDANAWLEASDAHFFYCIAPCAEEKETWLARMQFYSGEDPATGSAAGCCISWLVKHELANPDAKVLIRQGMAISRPSHITVQASFAHGRVGAVRVSGRTIPVAEGRFFL